MDPLMRRKKEPDTKVCLAPWWGSSCLFLFPWHDHVKKSWEDSFQMLVYAEANVIFYFIFYLVVSLICTLLAFSKNISYLISMYIFSFLTSFSFNSKKNKNHKAFFVLFLYACMFLTFPSFSCICLGLTILLSATFVCSL